MPLTRNTGGPAIVRSSTAVAPILKVTPPAPVPDELGYPPDQLGYSVDTLGYGN